MTYLVIDTETSGLPDWKLPADDPAQPRLCELAVIEANDELEPVTALHSYVRPEGWTHGIEPGAERAHGLTLEFLETHGKPIREVLAPFIEAAERGCVVVGHNVRMDLKILRGELRRAGLADLFEQTPNLCTMRSLVGICRIPQRNGRGLKWPTLAEACNHFNIPAPQVHGAPGDAALCLKLLRKMREIGLVLNPEVRYAKEKDRLTPSQTVI